MSTTHDTDQLLMSPPDPTHATATVAPVDGAAGIGTTTHNTSSEQQQQQDDEEASSGIVETGTKGERGKFLPRVKGLLSKDNEELLTKLVDVLEVSGCAAFRAAAVDNPWFEAFDRFYDAVEEHYVKPTGKNRVHKFKTKVVDMWATMESEIESGQKSPSDPIYSQAMRQWSVHQSVMKNPEAEIAKHKPGEPLATATTVPKSTGHHHPSTNNTNHAHAPGIIMSPNMSASTFVTTEYELERIRKSVLRLERMMVLNGWAQPKLPSPLNELHYLKEQMTATHFDVNVREAYQREITKYLTAARHQARHSNAPAHLPQLLDGLDTLRNTAQPTQLAWSIKETYDFVLRAYLQLLEPTTSQVDATPRKRKREGSASPATPAPATGAMAADLEPRGTVNEGDSDKNKTGDEEMVEIV